MSLCVKVGISFSFLAQCTHIVDFPIFTQNSLKARLLFFVLFVLPRNLEPGGTKKVKMRNVCDRLFCRGKTPAKLRPRERKSSKEMREHDDQPPCKQRQSDMFCMMQRLQQSSVAKGGKCSSDVAAVWGRMVSL